MEFKFIIDDVYLSRLFYSLDDNIGEVSWYLDLISHINVTRMSVYIAGDLFSKYYNGVSNTDIFYQNTGSKRDKALNFVIYQNKFFKKFNVNSEGSVELESFKVFAQNNSFSTIVTKENYSDESWWKNGTYNLFNDEGESVKCVRHLFIKRNICDNDTFKLVSAALFPKVHFHWSNKLRLENFEFDSVPMEWIVNSLSYLNDSAVDDYKKDPGQFMLEAKKLGLDLSPESTKTRRAARMMKERDIVIDEKNICCEWHFKYSKVQGVRIHFNFGYEVDEDVLKVTKGYPIVGIFARHLSIK